MPKVTILMGSQSDMEVMKKAADFLTENDIEVDMQVASAHRNPDRVHNICKDIEANGDVVITGAGGTFGWCCCIINNKASYRCSSRLFFIRWLRCIISNSSNAIRYPCCNCSH